MQVLRLFIEAEKKFPEKKCSILLKEGKTILESAVKLQNTVEEGSIPLWKEAYYSLIMIEKMLTRFPHLCFREDSKVYVLRSCYDHLMFDLIFLLIFVGCLDNGV